MSKSKKIFGCIGVTALFWLLSRFLPSIIGALAPNTILLRAVAMLAMLPTGWAAVKALSKGNFTGCIRANLYIFAFLEGMGAIEVITYMLVALAGSTGRYSYDIYGVAYSDYITYYGGLLLYEIIYVILCIYLAKNIAKAGASIEQHVEGKCPSTPLALHKDAELHTSPDAKGKENERIQELRKQISELEAALAEHDRAFAQNKPILAQAYSDEELIKMVTAGEFPSDRIKEYVDNRESLKMFISSAPWVRESMVKMISDSEAELNRLLSEGDPESFSTKVEPPSLEAMTQTKRSSSIEAVQHKDGDFYIKLRSGDFYLYRNFPRQVYLQMMNSPSMGDYYHQHIEGKYPCIQL